MPAVPALPPIATQPLSVVLLAQHAELHLDAVVADWVAFLNGLDRDYELLVVDAGSADRTTARAESLSGRFQRVRVVQRPNRPGEGAALRAGLREARFPLIAYASSDPGYQPDDLKRLLQEIDPVHLLSGYRAGRAVPPVWRMTGAVWRLICRVVLSHALTPLPGWLGWRGHAAQWLTRALFGVRNRDVLCPFRLLRRDILPRIPIQSDGPFAHVEILAKANFLGHLLGEDVPIGERQRPVPVAPRAPWRHYLREGSRVWRHPDFGPPRLPPATDSTTAATQ